jgi:HEAT repeat protein
VLLLLASAVSGAERPLPKPAPIAELVKLLHDGTRSDRGRLSVAKRLARSPDPEALPPLLKIIQDTREKGILRAAVIRALAETPHQQIVAPIVKGYLAGQETSPEVLAAAAEALGFLKDSTSIPLLLRASRAPQPEVRQAARSALLKIEGEGVDRTGILIDTLRDPDQPGTVRASAARRLGESQESRALPALSAALLEKGPESPRPATNLAEFFSARSAAMGDVRAGAARALGRLNSRQAIPPLLTRASSSDPELRVAVYEALASLKAREAVPAARKALSDPDQRVRRWAAVLLKEVHDPQALPDLRQALSDPDPGVRLQAAHALGGMEDRESIETMKRALQKETSEEVKIAFGEALERLSTPPR